MNLKEIEYIVTLAEEGKLARAAQRLFITPSALTQQVSNLEHEIGLPLFERLVSHQSRSDLPKLCPPDLADPPGN